MSKVNREKIEAWVKALRSGKYEQVQGALEINNKMCCLGVYCKVHDIPYDAQVVEGDDPTYDQFVIDWEKACKNDNHNNTTAYDRVKAELFEAGLNAHTYIDMNDNSGATFKEIADQIEMDLENDNGV